MCSRKVQWFTVHKGPNFSTSTAKPETDLTVDMLTSWVSILLFIDHIHIRDYNCSGAWKTSTFKKYNFEAEGIPTNGGALHPLLKVREEIRNIFLEMGCVHVHMSRNDSHGNAMNEKICRNAYIIFC